MGIEQIFIVKDENYVNFIKFYANEKENKDNKMNIMEKSRDIGPLYFDFDFKVNDKNRLFTNKDIQNIVRNMNVIIKKYLNIKIKSCDDCNDSDDDEK